MPALHKQRKGFDESNAIAARVIIQDLEPYGGEDAAIVQWAHAIQSRLDCEQEAICSDSQLRKARQ